VQKKVAAGNVRLLASQLAKLQPQLRIKIAKSKNDFIFIKGLLVFVLQPVCFCNGGYL
jgi:hypothetical protein